MKYYNLEKCEECGAVVFKECSQEFNDKTYCQNCYHEKIAESFVNGA